MDIRLSKLTLSLDQEKKIYKFFKSETIFADFSFRDT